MTNRLALGCLWVALASPLACTGAGDDDDDAFDDDGVQSPCERFVEATNRCTAAAGQGANLTDDICVDDSGGALGGAYDAYYACVASAYNRSDCATPEGLQAAALEVVDCMELL